MEMSNCMSNLSINLCRLGVQLRLRERGDDLEPPAAARGRHARAAVRPACNDQLCVPTEPREARLRQVSHLRLLSMSATYPVADAVARFRASLHKLLLVEILSYISLVGFIHQAAFFCAFFLIFSPWMVIIVDGYYHCSGIQVQVF